MGDDPMSHNTLRILETPEEMLIIENLQRTIWPGSEVDIVPAHLLLAVIHNGGLVIGAISTEDGDSIDQNTPSTDLTFAGFVFGFPGFYQTPDGPRLKHCSHMLGVDPDQRDKGIGFSLKRAQWQIIRHQGLDLITWTFDPLLSRNAYLNITKLGAVCNTYQREVYGEMRDGINAGLPSDRFQVDWWVNTQRVNRRLSRKARRPLDFAHYLAGGAKVINPSVIDELGSPRPVTIDVESHWVSITGESRPILLVEIPSDFNALKVKNPILALEWRIHSRLLFEALFATGYLVTDFVHLPGTHPRSYYVLCFGESTL
jgi:predicted GNAT superfamily acetyltransferase